MILRHVPEARIVAVPYQPLDRYAETLASVDIGCVPLADIPFNRCKSPQKSWEWALCGVPVVCSPTVYGAPDVHPGFEANGGPIASSVDEWEAHLTRLVEDRDERRRRVAQRVPWIKREHRTETQWPRWPAARRELVACRR